ncbi:MAG: hypothetical protein IRY94_06000 [Rhodospirillaceae bacterium]|nr:hypothetical protein [Rhodospirillaceae bacterium]
MATVKDAERRLAVVTSWAVSGGFGLACILTGFRDAQEVPGLIGFAVVIAGLVAHVIINRVFGTGFTNGEIVLGFIIFGVALLVFMAAWIADPAFGEARVVIGLAGFAAIIACFIAYIVTKHGLKGSFSMFHLMRDRQPAAGTRIGRRERDV